MDGSVGASVQRSPASPSHIPLDFLLVGRVPRQVDVEPSLKHDVCISTSALCELSSLR